MLSLLFAAAFAQDFIDAAPPSINAQHFRPSLDAKRTLWADDAQRGVHKTFFLRPLLHYTHQPLVYKYDDGSTVGLVSNIVQADLMAGFSFDRFRIGLDLPVYLFAESEALASTAGLGDVALDGKITVLDGDAPLGLAVQGRVGFPTGVRKIPLGSPKTSWEAAVVLDKGLSDRFFLMANLGYRGGPRADLENVLINDFFVWRAAGALAFTDASGAALEFAGDVPFTGTNTLAGMPIEGLLSAYAKIAPSLKLRGGAGMGLTKGVTAPDFRIILGFAWEAEKDLDLDNDGILDKDDACVDVAEDIDNEFDTDGCPEDIGSVLIQVVDEEGRPIEATQTKIPGTEFSGGDKLAAELPSGEYSMSASAEGYEPGEVQFSVADPDVDKVVRLVLKKVAIPMGKLIVEVRDAQGNTPEDVVIKIDGARYSKAPYELDMAPGSYPVGVSANGYRVVEQQTASVVDEQTTTVTFLLEAAQAKVTGDRIDLRDSVYFDTNKAKIQERSFGLLKDVVGILAEHPELTKIRIEGHTDSRGSATYNKDLSQRRATAVKQYLIDNGVAEARLEALGYGEEKPLDTRENAEAWDKNRRVDFFVAERSD